MPDSDIISKDNKNKASTESEISKLIKKIRCSADHDDVSDALYYELCYGTSNPPYRKWVATWLVKCIREKFSTGVKANILFASFALFPRYSLRDTSIQNRLFCYLGEGEYLRKYPSSSGRPIEDIEADPNAKDELEEIHQKLIKMENNCIHELIKYIENIPLEEINEHIANLEDYGILTILPDGKKVYKPNLEKLGYLEQKVYDLQETNSSHNNDRENNIAPPEIIRSKYIVKTGNSKRKIKSKIKKFDDILDMTIAGLKDDEEKDRIISVVNKALAEIATSTVLIVFIFLSSIYLHKTKTSEPNIQIDSDYVGTEPQQPTYPDTDKASDGGIKCDDQDIDSKLESSF